MQHRNPGMGRLRVWLPIILFCGFICAGLLLFLGLPKAEQSVEEKRVLAKAPDFTIQRLLNGSFGQDVDTYLSDHFPFRKFWVGTNARYQLYTGRNGVSGVYAGKDGYLLETPIQDPSGAAARNAARCAALAEQTGLPGTLLVVPSAGAVLQKELPSLHLSYEDEAILSQVWSAVNGKLQSVDLLPVFQGAEGQIYYRTDHHWTSLGAYLGYQALCPDLGLTALPADSFRIDNYGGFRGTTYARSGLWGWSSDTVQVWQGDESGIHVLISDGDAGTSEYNSMFFPENGAGDDPYTVFLDGNHGLVRITNANAETDRRLLIVRDSYAHCLAPFLAAHYAEIDLVDLRYYKHPVSQLIQERALNEILFVFGLDNLVTDTNFVFLK